MKKPEFGLLAKYVKGVAWPTPSFFSHYVLLELMA